MLLITSKNYDRSTLSYIELAACNDTDAIIKELNAWRNAELEKAREAASKRKK